MRSMVLGRPCDLASRLLDFIHRPLIAHCSGKQLAMRTVIAMAVAPSIAKRGVQVRSVSISDSPPIREKIQKPLSFIHEPTKEPLPIAVAR